jgi:hypothetical protein
VETCVKKLFLGFVLLLSSPQAFASPIDDFRVSLAELRTQFEDRYGLFEWKKERWDWTAGGEHDRILRQGERVPSLTEGQARTLVSRYAASARDYHAKVIYPKGGQVSLGVYVRSAGSRVFIVAVDSVACECNLKVGDEVLLFDGVPTIAAIRGLFPRPYTNLPGTDLRDAERVLTDRYGMLMEPQPKSPTARLVVRRKTSTLCSKIITA